MRVLQKPHLYSGIIGDGQMLAALSARGELLRIFWPHIDYAQQLERFHVGVHEPDQPIEWFHTQPAFQTYLGESNVLVTEYEIGTLSLSVTQQDVIAHRANGVVRHVTMKNTGTNARQLIGKALLVTQLGEHERSQAVRYNPAESMIVHYRRDTFCAFSMREAVFGFSCGDTSEALAYDTLLGTLENLGADSVLATSFGVIEPGETRTWTMYLAFGRDQKEAAARMAHLKATPARTWIERSVQESAQFLAQAKSISSGNERLDRLYRRSLLAFSLLLDHERGGMIAAPEFDPAWQACGGYGYCWGRDAAYIATALLQAGYTAQSEAFYAWMLTAQDEDGKWDHRHWLNGTVAPSWGYQADETASVVWGMWRHFQVTRDAAFLRRVYPAMQRAANHLLATLDVESGLPRESIDLWEERFAQHTYSSAAVHAALLCAVEASCEVAGDKVSRNAWREAAERIGRSIDQTLWNEARSCFYRSRRLHLRDAHTHRPVVDGKVVFTELDVYGYTRVIQSFDEVVDASLLGLSYPFAFLKPSDQRAVQVADAVREALWAPRVGGILRYENDAYVGGNPWILTTLWMGLDALRRADEATADEMLSWAAEHATELELFPEQVDRETGETRWVVPLTWSHAMFVLLMLERYGKKDQSAALSSSALLHQS